MSWTETGGGQTAIPLLYIAVVPNEYSWTRNYKTHMDRLSRVVSPHALPSPCHSLDFGRHHNKPSNAAKPPSLRRILNVRLTFLACL
jgi:hypothetical protein